MKYLTTNTKHQWIPGSNSESKNETRNVKHVNKRFFRDNENCPEKQKKSLLHPFESLSSHKISEKSNKQICETLFFFAFLSPNIFTPV